MSYILEALKKAQAERQLGSAPTVHTMTIAPAGSAGEGRGRVPMLAALGVALLGAGAIAAYVWRSAPVAAPAPAPSAVVLTAPAVAVTAAVPAPASPEMLPAMVTPPPAPAPAPVPAPVPATPALAKAPVVEKAAPAPASVAPKPASARAEAPLGTPPAEDSYPTQQSLPDAVQRELPQVVFGGYMYSKNPADRLLLIDKVLRHEGEEVAPGLTLEKLLPKAAVMNYRGFRYRVPY